MAIAAIATSIGAQADPTLYLTDGSTTVGPITGSGGLAYFGAVFGDNWAVIITSGTTKPLYGSATSPNLELSIQANCTGPGKDLTILFSDNNYGPFSGSLIAGIVGQAFSGAGQPVTYQAFMDSPGNAVLQLTTQLLNTGALTPV